MKFCFCSSIINHPSHYQEAGVVSMVEKKTVGYSMRFFFCRGRRILGFKLLLKNKQNMNFKKFMTNFDLDVHYQI